MSEHEHDEQARGGEFDVAVVGMALRFPGAETLDEFWSNLRDGVESITHFTADELVAAGVPRAALDNPDYVRSIGKLRDVRHFDAGFFGYSPREAEALEPAHRLFLECAWEALEDAGVDPSRFDGQVGVYGGAGNPSYADRNVRQNPAALAAIGDFAVTLASGKDFVATRASYKLDLRGPSLTVQTGCSTSLVAIHLAAQSLLRGECDLALAGGSSIFVPQDRGYLYSHGGIQSPDGHCRAFDARAQGTVPGTGTGIVVLRRLEDALRDGDPIRAVIRGSAVNNDGAAKVAYTAPGVDGQSAVIGEAMSLAGVDASSITFVEGHGSGTELGDVIELAALTRTFRAATDRTGYCALGSVKTNLGHLDTAAGAAGFIKTVLSLEHGIIPPSLNFDTPNPKTELATSPFFVPTRAVEWKTDGGPRLAGVSSFGIGGTNAHVVLEEAPAPVPSGPSRPWQVLTLSARSAAALDAAAERLATRLEADPHLPLADVADTLQRGRRAFAHRRTILVREGEDAVALLRGKSPERAISGQVAAASPSVVFLFSGLGDHYPNMARGLYEAEPVFRAEFDRCADLLRPHLGADLREVLFHGEAPSDAPAPEGIDLRRMLAKEGPSPEAERLSRTELAQPAVFAVDYALAQLWMSWGIVPEAVVGHSLGEYAAACVAGILSLEDAAALVAGRAKLIQALPGGAMLAVPLDPSAVAPYLTTELAVATVNAPGLSVVAGPDEAIAALEERLRTAGHVARRLATTHAFHSPMLMAAAEPLAALASRARLRPPSIPMISNVTGTWITDAEATDPAYWTRHLLGTVRFAEGIGELLMETGRVFLEVGPGQTLATFVRQRPGGDANLPAAVVASVRYAYDRKPDAAFLAEALGRLWLAGVEIDWAAYRAGERRNRLHLPTYPWEKQAYWVDPVIRDISSASESVAYGKLPDPADWTYLPTWERHSAPVASEDISGRVLVLSDGGALAESVAAALAGAGASVVVARAGDRFAEDGSIFVLRTEKDDFAALAAALADDRPTRIVHAWSDSVSLLLLAEAFGHGERAEVVVLTRGAVEVTGDEDAADPADAARVGASRVVPLEYPSLACRGVDVDGDAVTLAARVAAD
ncbi:MAG TPA: type I polyketide synthase, partial [Longimicrobium sp.]|nr:type I polyketide synthase [Longimicrobium sp.]